MKYFYAIIGLFLLLFMVGCPVDDDGPSDDGPSDDDPSDNSYLIIIHHEMNSFGSSTQVEIYEGLSTTIEGADVRINDVQLSEQSLFGYTYYSGSSLAGNDYGDEVTFTISIDGESILEETMNVPSSAVTITDAPEPFDVSEDQVITWTGPTDCDEYRVLIGWGSTVSGEDYEPVLPSTATSHTIPANTVLHDPDPSFDWFNLEVHAVNTMDLDDFNNGSSIEVSAYEWTFLDEIE